MSNTTSRKEWKKRRQREIRRAIAIIIAVVVLAILAICLVIKLATKKEEPEETQTTTTAETTTEEMTTTVEETTTEADPLYSSDETLRMAQKYAYMYDYDKAISILMGADGYEENTEYVNAVFEYNNLKNSLVKWADNTQIPHIFFHTLVVDVELAFDGDEDAKNYNQVMTTVSEFNKTLEQMYANGYVLVSIYDIASMKTDADGNQVMSKNDIYLPAGKKPFVLSLDDCSYYAYMSGDGFATKLVVDANGKVTNEYVNRDGSVVYGSYDVGPLLDDFIEAHPDFSYKGAKGIIALTGYEGVLGYRTSEYSYGANSTGNKDFLYVNENIEADRAMATYVAQAIKDDGWLFACHGWGHRAMGSGTGFDSFVTDINMWYNEVIPIIGPTDILIYPKGDDIGNFWGYTRTDKQYAETLVKYQHCKNLGFNYFCNVDSSDYWVQISSEYMRMGRRNIDGTRLYEALCGYRDLLDDLIDAKSVWDDYRPQPVLGVNTPESYVIPDTLGKQ